MIIEPIKYPEISENSINLEITLAGWVSSVRDHGELIFIDLRDSSNQIFQVRLSRETFPNLDELVKIKTRNSYYCKRNCSSEKGR